MIDPDHRNRWLERRRQLEAMLTGQRIRHTPQGQRGIGPLGTVMAGVDWAIRSIGAFDRWRRNASDVRLVELDLHFPHLPPAFDGYRILFLSDLHVERLLENMARATALAEGLRCDLALLGGDYQHEGQPPAAAAARIIAPLAAALHPADGLFAILGNHDSHKMVAPLEALGIRLLLNESVDLVRDGQSIRLIGCDDVHLFYDHSAEAALHHGEGFRIALVHSPDFAGQAATAGCSLYLTGHTHGGQVCLPGGRPIVTALDRHHDLARGAWRLHGMQGYTSTGLGAGLPAIRYNCPPELALITLRRTGAA